MALSYAISIASNVRFRERTNPGDTTLGGPMGRGSCGCPASRRSVEWTRFLSGLRRQQRGSALGSGRSNVRVAASGQGSGDAAKSTSPKDIYALRIVCEFELARDGKCSGGMIARDHFDRDAGGAALGDGGDGLGTGRVDEANQPQKVHIF